MRTVRLILLILPWIIIILFVLWNNADEAGPTKTVTSTIILQEVESLGKLELVKYKFKEITEVEELSEKYLKIFQLGPDSKIALISEGEAIGCIDLTKINTTDIQLTSDTLFIQLPEPELCNYKLDMDKTRIYSIQTNPLKDERAFIQNAYRSAENEIKKAALASGLLEQTKANAITILKPFLERASGRKVVFVQKPEDSLIKEF
ncbi:MAG: DUF4230 domain-containing protein [Fulvivirga sp.]|nr:DUF4230 domain-containing protein [Fulvivirga sp.]